MPSPSATRYSRRWMLADQVTAAVRRRYPMEIQSIGVHGSLAHGDDTEASDVDLIVVTRWSGTGPRAGSRRIDGMIVDLDVVSAEDYLRHARTLTTSWPLVADRYLTTRALHDPDAWLPKLRDTHLSRLARAAGGEFAALGREAWCEARSAYARAAQLAQWDEPDTAVLALGNARLGTALVDGLLTRTYFRNSGDALRRTGVAGADLADLDGRLRAQAEELARCGRPVDGDVTDLVG